MEHIFSTDLEIRLIIEELIIGRRTPTGTRYGIGELGEDPFQRCGVRVFKRDRCVLWLIVPLRRLGHLISSSRLTAFIGDG